MGSGEYSNKVYSMDPSSNGEVLEMLELSMTVAKFGPQNSFATFAGDNVFLAVGFGNNSYQTEFVLQWNRWNPSFEPFNNDLPGRQLPGNAMIPLRHVPICESQSRMWKLIVNHVKPTRFPIGGWNENMNDDQNSIYSHFQMLEEFRCEGRFHFRLIYPELGTYNEWYQTNDPSLQSNGSATDFIGVALGMPLGFNGLVHNNR
ncbi:hypothetical protein TCAL_08069, partial [Tigriopus californicus]|eukprot:TCALIF_08069-PA protein Name:"Protein of unknown function" AED:0.29 eAED:0.29 QI:8/0.66/0.5/0.75/0.66/0.75/4/0/202